MYRSLQLLFLIITTSQVFAQTHPCGFTSHMNERYAEEPSLLEMREAYELEIQQIINTRSNFTEKTIPVVVHIIYNDSNSNISDSQVSSALTAINQDFNASNPDYYTVITAFNSVKSDLNINFELANLDPDGNATSGITRTQSDLTDSAGENVKALINWDSNMYLNIWVVDNIESGAGAYAYYPGTAPNGNEGIVCRHSQFGTWGTSSNSNFASTTLTHEIGHYLNLAHTWGNSNEAELQANCDEDDGVSDTPNTIGTLYGCNTSQSTCGSLDNVQNFMDYTECTNMFTAGQRSRVHAALHSAQGGRVNLWQSENLIATGLAEDSTCEEEQITVQIFTQSYASEISWVILNDLGEAVTGGGIYNNNSTYSTPVCLEQGSYTFQSIDSYGDGWNGSYYYIRNCENTIIANDNNPSGYGETISFTVSSCGAISGCTNSTANNYNELATEDDGSCIIEGCTNAEATNYNPIANLENGSCIIDGCIDETALNYNPEANQDNGTCEYVVVPDFFSYELTGANHTLVLPEDMGFTILNMPISNSDIIGVFFSDENGNEYCAGYQIWYGTTCSIAVQGDDATTTEIDGLQEGGDFTLKVWDQSENISYYTAVQYSLTMPNQGSYTSNGISAITNGYALPPTTSQTINLEEGWSIFSTFLQLENMDVALALNPITENIIIVKDFQGAAYLADWGFNGIGDLVYGSGYQIKLSQPSILVLTGEYNAPEEAQINLAIGWSLFGYLRTQAAECMAVLESINTDIEIVKDAHGLAFLPEWGFNGIGNLKPGEGYQIKMNSAQILQFNSNSEDY